jgi:lysophospholipase-2
LHFPSFPFPTTKTSPQLRHFFASSFTKHKHLSSVASTPQPTSEHITAPCILIRNFVEQTLHRTCTMAASIPNLIDKIANLLDVPNLLDDPPDYPDPFVLKPLSTHITTLILLHGTSTSGIEFGMSLNNPIIMPVEPAPSMNTMDLHQLLPYTKLVFPTGKLRPTTVFEGRNSNAWFDMTSFSDRSIDETKQIEGIKESILYLEGLIASEVEALGDAGKVVIGGFSQGCAMVGILMLSGVLDKVEIGGWVGMSGWLPFRLPIDRVIGQCVTLPEASVGEVYAARRAAVKEYLSRDITGITAQGVTKETGANEEEGPEDIQRLWMGHGVDDTKVPLEWGAHMKKVMLNLGVNVTMKEYAGLGHSNNENEMKDMVEFLKTRWAHYLPLLLIEST